MFEKIKKFSDKNSLLANSFNLIASTGVTAIFGFVFWIVVARSFHSQAVGLATTLLSVSSLIALLGQAGFDTVFVRFLSKSKHRNEQINSGLVISGVATIIIAALFCLFLPLLSPKLKFIDTNPLFITEFIVFTIFTTWNTLTNAIFVAYRKTQFVVIINIIFSAVKMLLPFAVHSGGPMTIFLFAGIAQVINVVLSIAVLVRRFEYRPTLRIDFTIVRETLRFSMATYASNILNLLPDTVLPLIVVDKLGASAAAYFYIAFTIANLLYTIAFATTQALLAEASHDEDHMVEHVRHGLRIVTTLLIPSTIFVIIVCPLVLSFFGETYRSGATNLLRILCLSSIAVMLYTALGTIFKLTHNLAAILATTATNAVVIIVLGFVFVKPWGLNGIGWAWLIGSFASVIVGFLFTRHSPYFGRNQASRDAS